MSMENHARLLRVLKITPQAIDSNTYKGYKFIHTIRDETLFHLKFSLFRVF